LERRGQRLEVDYPQCSIPDTFRELGYHGRDGDGGGKLAADGRFAATQIMAKCPSKYEERARAAASATAGAAPPELRIRLD
jgi:cytochrome c-type biogenesis protein CcmE